MNRGISQWERERRKVLMAWWPRWQLVKKRDSRLISQCVILPHCCLYTMLSHLFFALFLSLMLFLSLFLSLLHISPPFPFFTYTVFIFLVITFFFLKLPLFVSFPTTPLFRLNAMFSLNVLFFLTSTLHPSQWPRVTPGRIITLGWNIGSVAPYSALSTRIIHLWSIPFCGEPSSYSPVMIGVLATLCICTVI